MFKFCFVGLLLFAVGFAANADEPTIAYKLAVLESQDRGLSKYDYRVKMFTIMLDYLSLKTGSSQQQIADMTLKTSNNMNKKGIKNTTMALMMEASIGMSGHSEKVDYAQLMALMSIMMASGN